ncbi:MAG: YihY family inner membrane protein [Zoogloeaceae bacterium]|nr:YihY family inner membrane protein [Zoogloeaceae bacterium]
MWFQELRRFLQLLVERFAAHRCSQVASSLAFTTLLSLVPLITVAIAVFGRSPFLEGLGDELRQFLIQNLLPEKAGRIIATYALQFSLKAANLTVFGSVLLALGALTLIVTIDRAFNHIWGVHHHRPWRIRIPLYWVTVTLGPLILAGVVAASSFVVTASIDLVGDTAWMRRTTLHVAPYVLMILFFSFLYRAIPNRFVEAAHALAGGIVATSLVLLVQKALTAFIAGFASFNLIYGTFAALPIFLLWLYFLWVAILTGALVASTLPVFADARRLLPAFPGDRAYAAIRMLCRLAEGQDAGQAVNTDSLHGVARLGTANSEHLLETMQSIGWIVRSETGQWHLAVSAERLTVADVLKHLTLTPRLPAELASEPLTPDLMDLYARCLASANTSVAELARKSAGRAHSGIGSNSN